MRGKDVYNQLCDEYHAVGPSGWHKHYGDLLESGALSVADVEACARYQSAHGKIKLPLGDAGYMDSDEEDDFFAMMEG